MEAGGDASLELPQAKRMRQAARVAAGSAAARPPKQAGCGDDVRFGPSISLSWEPPSIVGGPRQASRLPWPALITLPPSPVP